MAPVAAVSELAPTGKLRAAINFGNPVLAGRDAATGEPCGISRGVQANPRHRRRLSRAIEEPAPAARAPWRRAHRSAL